MPLIAENRVSPGLKARMRAPNLATRKLDVTQVSPVKRKMLRVSSLNLIRPLGASAIREAKRDTFRYTQLVAA